jgi:hypothetical protein
MSKVKKKFVFCADLHLDDGAWTTRPAIFGDSYYSFDQIVDYCITHKLPVILGGDVLDRKQNLARPIARLCAALSRLESAGIPAYFIQGNHEFDRHIPWLLVHPWSQHVHQKTIDFDGLKVYSLDWLPRGDIQEAFAKVPAGTDILITHQVWQDFMQNVGRTECELTDVHNTQIVLSGDFHVTKTVTSKNAAGECITMHSPGSTCMQDMGESPTKYFLVIGSSDKKITVDLEPIKTRKVVRHTINTQDELDDLCAGKLLNEITALVAEAQEENYPTEITTPLVRVKFAKDIPDAYLRVATVVGTQAHLFCEALPSRGAKETVSSAQSRLKTDLLSVVAELTKGNDAVTNFASKLLTAVDPAREIDALLDAITAEPNSEDSCAIVET